MFSTYTHYEDQYHLQMRMNKSASSLGANWDDANVINTE